jgi:hypothetical protein
MLPHGPRPQAPTRQLVTRVGLAQLVARIARQPVTPAAGYVHAMKLSQG